MSLLPELYSSTHGSCWPSMSVMPFPLVDCTSLSQIGGISGEMLVVPALGKPGVTLAAPAEMSCGGIYCSATITGRTLVLILNELPGKVRNVRLLGAKDV